LRRVSRAIAPALGIAAGVLAGCLHPPSPAAPRTPVRWIVVERTLGEVIPGGRVGDGQADPGAVVLSVEPLHREDLEGPGAADPSDPFVEVLEISPGPWAAPGETVTARVRVARAEKGEIYRLVATASRPDVKLIGAHECVVHGGEPARFRFTSLSSGPGGIAVGVEKLGPPGRARP
jgi:hypothetical protein